MAYPRIRYLIISQTSTCGSKQNDATAKTAREHGDAGESARTKCKPGWPQMVSRCISRIKIR
eukprot:6172388-Pleurochrysis_carterae.AAC.1